VHSVVANRSGPARILGRSIAGPGKEVVLVATVPDTQPTTPEQNGGDDAAEFPETWLWDEHGDVCSGRFVRFDKAATREYGKKLIMILEVAGAERSVWLLQTALYGRVRDELGERPQRRLEVGERVAIHRLTETKTEDGKRTYRPFRIYFPDRPELDVASEFDLDKPTSAPEPKTATETTGGSDALDDDIPF
jgi:hypothetical protein